MSDGVIDDVVVVPEEVATTPDYSEMSDEDFLNEPMPDFMLGGDEVVEEVDEAPVVEDNEPAEIEEEEVANEVTESEDEPVEQEPDVVEPTIDASAEMARLLAPFKANGKERKVENVDEAIKLMQMGAGYSKAMSALKPQRKLIKMLENNDLLDETKLNKLIDIAQHNPDAIAQLVRESGVNPLDITTEAPDKEYVPGNHTVSEQSVDLDIVLDRIRGTDTYQDTMQVVGKQWDSASQDTLTANPKLIEAINTQMSNGIYEQISREVDKQTMFGELSGLSDYDAYLHVGRQLHAQGAFNGSPEQKPAQAPVPVREAIPTKPVKKADKALNAKRLAASNNKPNTATQSAPNFGSMSDAEFLKLSASQFLK